MEIWGPLWPWAFGPKVSPWLPWELPTSWRLAISRANGWKDACSSFCPGMAACLREVASSQPRRPGTNSTVRREIQPSHTSLQVPAWKLLTASGPTSDFKAWLRVRHKTSSSPFRGDNRKVDWSEVVNNPVIPGVALKGHIWAQELHMVRQRGTQLPTEFMVFFQEKQTHKERKGN